MMTPEERVGALAQGLGTMYGLLVAVLPAVRWESLLGLDKATIEVEMEKTLQEAGIKP